MIFVILLASLSNSYANDNTCGGDGVGLSLNPGGEGAMNINLGKGDGEGNGHNTVNVVNVYNKENCCKKSTGPDEGNEGPGEGNNGASSGDFIMVVGGGGNSNLAIDQNKTVHSDSYFLSLNPEKEVPPCVENIPFPHRTGGGAGASVRGIPTYCGGTIFYGSPVSYYSSDRCWQYDFDDGWYFSSFLNKPRLFPGFDYHPSWGLIVASGSYNNIAPMVDVTRNGKAIHQLAPLPVAPFVVEHGRETYHTRKSCVVAADGDRIFSTSSGNDPSATTGSTTTTTTTTTNNGSKLTLMYNRGDDEWTRMPDKPRGTFASACALVNLSNGDREIVVVGGHDNTTGITDYVDIFSLETMSWRQGPSFPTPISETNAVPFKETFIVAGGNKGEATDMIYKYNLDGTWTLLPQTLKTPVVWPVIMNVDENKFPRC